MNSLSEPRWRGWLYLPQLLVLLAACAGTPSDRVGPGEPPEPLETVPTRTVLEGVYTAAQAERGRGVYLVHCAECHREDLRGQEMAPGLIGTAFSFRWRGATVMDIYASLRLTMPQATPGSLTEQAYADLIAYMLSENQFPSGEIELPPNEAELASIRVERIAR